MKRLYLLSFILCGTMVLTAQTVFNPATDYLYCDFENSNVNILDDDGDPTTSKAFNGLAWGNLSGSTSSGKTAAAATNPVTTGINTSTGVFRYSFPKTDTSAGIYINIKGWDDLGMNKSILDYKSMRFKIHTNENEIVGNEIGLKVTVGQLNAGGGQRVIIDSIPVTFDGNDWIEFSFDLSGLQPATNELPYQFVDVSVWDIPDRSAALYGTYFRLDDIIFSTTALINGVENHKTSVRLLSYDPTSNSLNITNDKTASKILVYNALGQIVKRSEQISRLDMSEMVSGVYVANALIDGNKQTLKFIR